MKPEIVDLNEIVGGVDKMLQRLLGEDIDIIFVPDKDIGFVNADKGQLEQVIVNLAVNARDAMPTGGKLTIETKSVFLDDEYAGKHASVVPGPHVMIAMSDTGCGMDKKTMAKLFEPFFTTKPVGKGTGLGLAMVFGIVKQSGGDINVYSEPGRGTTFKIYLPCVDAKAGTGGPSRQIAKPSKGNETILLVEDDDSVRTLILSLLADSGYTILEACNGNDALKVCREHTGKIHLLLSDVVMPGMSGRELSNQITQLHPRMKVLFMSGYTDDAIHHHGVLDPGTAFIEKPFSQVSLKKKIREVLSYRGNI